MEEHLLLEGQISFEQRSQDKIHEYVFEDKDFTDVYWQQSSSDRYMKSQANTRKWLLRSRADAQHGQGAEGRAAIQQAIHCGIYKSMTTKSRNKDGKTVEVDEVCIAEGEDISMHVAELSYKHRAGCSSTAYDFKKDVV